MTDNISAIDEIKDLHRFLTIIQSINVGIIVIDKAFKVHVWNSFMEINSGFSGVIMNGKSIFEFFPDLAHTWFKDKVLETFSMEVPIFSPWEQHEEVFHFQNNRPFTGTSQYMYQNFTFIPINSLNGTCEEVCIIIYDVTDAACSKLGMQEANAQLHQLSITDGLTNLYNRKHWQECLTQQYRLFMRNHMPVSLMMFDIDHFKKVNDTYGHPAGDAVLRSVSAVLRKQIRNTDMAERLRKAIEASVVKVGNLEIKFTISLGLCTLSENITSPEQWLQFTDKSMYYSKEHGRNRTTQYGLNDDDSIPKVES